MPSLATLKLIGIAVGIAVVLGLLASYRHSLIEMGKNIVYAEDNAANSSIESVSARRCGATEAASRADSRG